MYHRTYNSRNILFVNTNPIIYHRKRAAPAAALFCRNFHYSVVVEGRMLIKTLLLLDYYYNWCPIKCTD